MKGLNHKGLLYELDEGTVKSLLLYELEVYIHYNPVIIYDKLRAKICANSS
jgi:hypothetical protein